MPQVLLLSSDQHCESKFWREASLETSLYCIHYLRKETGVGDLLGVRMGVAVGRGVGVGDAVGFLVGVLVRVGVAVGFRVGVLVALGMGVRVAVAVAVGILVGVKVNVGSGVGVKVKIGSGVGLGIGVDVGWGTAGAVGAAVGCGSGVAVARGVGVEVFEGSVGATVGVRVGHRLCAMRTVPGPFAERLSLTKPVRLLLRTAPERIAVLICATERVPPHTDCARRASPDT